MNRTHISDRHYFLVLTIPILVASYWYLDTKSNDQRNTKKKQSKVISCGTSSFMKVGKDMFAGNSMEMIYDEGLISNRNRKSNVWLFTSTHPCSHRSGPGVGICMIAGHKRRFLKITAIHTREAEHYYS